MSFEQYPFHNQEIPTLTKEIPVEGGLELMEKIEDVVNEVMAGYTMPNMNPGKIEELRTEFNREATIMQNMGDSTEQIEEQIGLNLRKIGAIKK